MICPECGEQMEEGALWGAVGSVDGPVPNPGRRAFKCQNKHMVIVPDEGGAVGQTDESHT